ncbi:mRNA-capping enzyme subunit alpha, putative [Entamoeba dispar SAW760]|uniref:mRNA-capping enzyme subunit alpha, putative n=1 Tax=Entamoeba dispar (strain ATCC PRA-260 / SAW760) TaxID=370354 RepID=B0EAR4_ENTDS|nr:mRNA-capping enzyme subunit alpha, putative [Entamoeba dispar SAW760]EDR28379.1 mRNA-capping enzyme subunit alpha, putative [Entamoeba dispar SAW760]|eukprot:EDR28379.1 mRNA-capping enzyme subunit alpha, putative [Entamoeba dispar SAW760]
MEVLENFRLEPKRSYFEVFEEKVIEGFEQQPDFVEIEFGRKKDGEEFIEGITRRFYEILTYEKEAREEIKEIRKSKVREIWIDENTQDMNVFEILEEERIDSGLVFDLNIKFGLYIKEIDEEEAKSAMNLKTISKQKYYEHSEYTIIAEEISKYQKEGKEWVNKTIEHCLRIRINKTNDEVLIHKICSDIYNTIKDINNVETNGIEQIDIQQIPSELSRQYLEKIFKVFGYELPTDPKFPGTKPIFISRQHYKILHNIKFHDKTAPQYLVCEKSKGKKYFLMFDNNEVLLIDEEMNVFSVQYPLITNIYKEGLTIIDGEMIENIQTKKPTFLCNDILIYNNTVTTNYLFTERLQILGKEIILKFREEISKNNIPDDEIIFILNTKPFLEIKLINKLFEVMKKTKYGITFIDGKRFHLTEGFLFYPNSKYIPFTNNYFFKWQFNDTITCKLGIQEQFYRNSRKVSLCCKSYYNTSIVYLQQVNFDSRDLCLLEADKTKYNVDENAVLECCYNAKEGRWKYLRILSNDGNFDTISTIITILESNAGQIDITELMFSIPNLSYVHEWKNLTEKASLNVLKSLNL